MDLRLSRDQLAGLNERSKEGVELVSGLSADSWSDVSVQIASYSDRRVTQLFRDDLQEAGYLVGNTKSG